MSTARYQGSGAGAVEASVAPVVTSAASTSSHAPERRRKSPISLTLPLPLSMEQPEETMTPSSSAAGMPMPPYYLENDERHASMSEILCKLIVGKSKSLVFGQVLSLMLAGSGAIQSALYLDCHLSAPTFSMLSFYFPLSIVCLTRLIWKERDHITLSRKLSSKSLHQNAGSIENQEIAGQVDEISESQQPTQQPSGGLSETTTIKRAKPEKRNHLLSRWSQLPPSTEMEDDVALFGMNGSGDEGSIDVIDAQTSSSAKAYSFFGIIPLHSSLRMYAILAIFDVYANYTTITAFKYTTITSVSLFDALAIPTAISVSRIFFGRRYTKIHLLGVTICSIGIALNVLQDYREDKHLKEVSDDEESAQEQLIEKDYPYKMRGDVLAVIGGTLFGITNTLQEVTVRDSNLVEYLGCMTFFASIISFIQFMILERDEVIVFFSQSTSGTCSKHDGVILLFAFALVSMLNYTGIGAFLQISDAAFLNLSLLTGDAWAVAFSVFGQGIVPPASFYVALVITVSGVFIYETAPSPVMNLQNDFVGGIQMAENAVRPSGQEPNDQEGHVLA